MQLPHWTVKPSLLFQLPTANEDPSNSNARLVLLATLLSRVLQPTRSFWMAGVMLLVYMWFSATPMGETFGDEVLVRAVEGMEKADAPKKEAPPREQVVASVNRELDKRERMAQRGAEVKYEYLKNLMDDKKKRALNFTRSPREMNPRGEVVWSEQQRIYGNRNYVKPSTEEYDDLFYGDVGMFKFLSRRT